MRKPVAAFALIAVLAEAAFIWLAVDADVVSFSESGVIRFMHCDDPKDFNDHNCSRRYCEEQLIARKLVPADHRLMSTGVTARKGNVQVQVEGLIKRITASADESRYFRCLVTGNSVDKIEVVSANEWAERVATGKWGF